MSTSDNRDFSRVADEFARQCAEAVDDGQLECVTESQLAAALAALLRLLAARAQANLPIRLNGGNNRISATDGAIASTAILESVGIEVFELAAWQAMTNLGSSKRPQIEGAQKGSPT